MSLANPTLEQKELLLNMDLSGVTKGGQDKEYARRSAKAWRKYSDKTTSIKEFVHSYKLGIGCNICGYKKSPYSLVFHHKDDNKVISISRAMSRNWSKEEIMFEMKKCRVLCRNCHGELHGVTYDTGDLKNYDLSRRVEPTKVEKPKEV